MIILGIFDLVFELFKGGIRELREDVFLRVVREELLYLYEVHPPIVLVVGFRDFLVYRGEAVQVLLSVPEVIARLVGFLVDSYAPALLAAFISERIRLDGQFLREIYVREFFHVIRAVVGIRSLGPDNLILSIREGSKNVLAEIRVFKLYLGDMYVLHIFIEQFPLGAFRSVFEFVFSENRTFGSCRDFFVEEAIAFDSNIAA